MVRADLGNEFDITGTDSRRQRPECCYMPKNLLIGQDAPGTVAP